MLFRQEQWSGLADGSITVAFRRWRRPTVRAGGTLKSPAGVLQIDEVAVIDEHEVTDDDARAAGHPDRASVLAALGPSTAADTQGAERRLYRIRFRRVGDDPRIALRERDELTDDEFADLIARLNRLGWAVPVLRSIRDHPGVVSSELANAAGLERQSFKQRVRRLKELGLTESLDVGYRLSPRGHAMLRRLDAAVQPLGTADRGIMER